MIVGSPASAASVDDWAKCQNAEKPDIASCSNIIGSLQDKKKLASALLHRGFIYMGGSIVGPQGDLDKALADFNAGIALASSLTYAAADQSRRHLSTPGQACSRARWGLILCPC